MLAESLEGLAVRPGGRYVDCTFGRGGHSRAILERLGVDGCLLAMDKDEAAVSSGEARNLAIDARFEIVHASYVQLGSQILQRGWQGQIDGVLMDLGVSSPQLDEAERGFSFMRDGSLDMRMDRSRGVTAADWIRVVGEKELDQVLREYGEERYARRIARAIVAHRAREAIVTTQQLASIIAGAIPRWERGQHPATRSFQAIRIRVNQELEELQVGLSQAVDALRGGGRLVVIAFHSLEDRIVKRLIRDESRGRSEPGGVYAFAEPQVEPRLRRVGRAQKPQQGEIDRNPRARSAVLRVAERLPT